MNWKDLKPGDRVRVTFEADVVERNEYGVELNLSGLCNVVTSIDRNEADAATWELLDPPLRVGRAKFRINNAPCEVLAIHGDVAWIKYDDSGGYNTVAAPILINIDEEPQP